MTRPIGLDVTDYVLARASRLPRLRLSRRLQMDVSREMDERLISGAVWEALAQYERHMERGFILYDPEEPRPIWYVPADDWDQALTRLKPATRQQLQDMLVAYYPDSEAVIVSPTIHRIRLLHLDAQGDIQAGANHKRIALKRPEPIQFPPGVSFEKTTQPDGLVVYAWTHDEWGPLGRIVISGHGAGHTQFRAEPAPDPRGHPFYKPKLQLFTALAEEIERKYLHATRQTNSIPPGGVLGTAQTIRLSKLYAAFMQIPNDFEMAQFAQRLTAAEIDELLAVTEAALPRARGTDAIGMGERLAMLRQLRETPAAVDPLAQALYNYLQLNTEAEGRAYLQAQTDLLLTDEAEEAMAEFFGHGADAQAHVERFRGLLRRMRGEVAAD